MPKLSEQSWQRQLRKIRENKTTIQLDFSYTRMDSKQAIDLAEALKANRSLQRINLSENNIGAAGAQALAEALKVNRSLQGINLSGNNIGVAGAQAFAEALKVNSRLRRINLQYNNIGAAGAQLLAEALKVNKSLREIVLEQNDIGAAGAQAFAGALKVNESLQTLRLWHNDIGAAGAQALAEALKVNESLREIDLGQNDIGDDGAQALAEALKAKSRLQRINLLYSGIGAAGAQALAEALKVNKSLQEIDLRENDIRDAGIQALTEALKFTRGVTIYLDGEKILNSPAVSSPQPEPEEQKDQASGASRLTPWLSYSAVQNMVASIIPTVFSWPKPSLVGPAPELKFAEAAIPVPAADAKREAAKPADAITLHCESGWPHLPTPPFVPLDGSILLAQVILHWALSHQQPARKLLPAADAADKVSGSALQARFQKLNADLTVLEDQAAALPPDQKQAYRWLNFALSEHREQLEKLQIHSRVSVRALIALEEDVAASQEEWAEQSSEALSDSLISPVCPVSPHFFPTLSSESRADSRTKIRPPEDMRRLLRG